MNLTPIKDQILVEPIVMPERIGSIIIPDQARRMTQQAVVVALGSKATVPVKAGDRVHITAEGGTQFEHDGRKLYLLREADIVAIVE